MAVAIHMRATNTMEYSHKNYDPTKWKLYSGWSAVKHLPKFSYVRSAESEDSEAGAETGLASDGMPSSAASPESLPARVTKRGRDVAKFRECGERRRSEREDGRDARLSRVDKTLSEITVVMRRKHSVNTLVQAFKVPTNEETKEKRRETLVELALAE